MVERVEEEEVARRIVTSLLRRGRMIRGGPMLFGIISHVEFQASPTQINIKYIFSNPNYTLPYFIDVT